MVPYKVCIYETCIQCCVQLLHLLLGECEHFSVAKELGCKIADTGTMYIYIYIYDVRNGKKDCRFDSCTFFIIQFSRTISRQRLNMCMRLAFSKPTPHKIKLQRAKNTKKKNGGIFLTQLNVSHRIHFHKIHEILYNFDVFSKLKSTSSI